MNLRIRPDDLETSPYNELIHTLAGQWAGAVRVDSGMRYDDYAHAIAIQLLTTQQLERTTAIVGAVLRQAVELGKPSAWVAQELKFEGMIEGADRDDFLRLDLSQTSPLDDAALDLYNERVTRFRND